MFKNKFSKYKKLTVSYSSMYAGSSLEAAKKTKHRVLGLPILPRL